MNVRVTLTSALLLAASLPAQDENKPTQDRAYDLMVGDPAPQLAIQTWVKGEAVDAFEKDKIYVVEFWATWCGPCIGGMPHLSELQEQYADQDVRIIGVNIWDEPKNVEPFMKNDAPIHNKPGDEIMRYTVAIEKKHDPDDIQNGMMVKQWMAAAGQNGIPSAFIVDQNGRIAWIGHPASIDDALAQVVAGEWDLEVETLNYAVRVAGKAKVDRYNRLFRSGDYAEAYELGLEVVRGPLANDAMSLNTIAWNIVDPDNTPKTQDLELALEAAVRANELTGSANSAILDTLAKVHYDRGELTEAVKWQRLAVESAKGDAQVDPTLLARLKQFEKEAAVAEASGKKKIKK